MTRLRTDTDSSDPSGFTLVELIITITVVGILMSAVGTGLITMFRTSGLSATRLTLSHDAQLLTEWITTDLQSAGTTAAVTNPATSTGCASSPAYSATSNLNIMRLSWTDKSTQSAYSASYRAVQVQAGSPGVWQLVRYWCQSGQAAVSFPVVRTLKDSSNCSAAQSVAASACVLPVTAGSASLSLRITSSSGGVPYTYTATASVRTAIVGADTAAPTPQAVLAYNTDAAGLAGYVKRVAITFNKALNPNYTAGTAPWTLVSTPNGASLASVAVNGSVATLTLTGASGSPVNTIGAGFTVALAANANGVRDGAANLASFAAMTVVDAMAPVALSASAMDTNADGRIDHVAVTMSEASAANGALPAADFTVTTPPAWAGMTLGVSAATVTGTTVTLTLVATAGVIPVDTAASGLSVSMSADPNGLRDAGGSFGAFGPTTAVDSQPPILLTLTSADTNADGKLDRIVAVFSEPLAAYTVAPASTGWTLTKPVSPAGWAGATPTISAVTISGSTATLTIGGAGLPVDTAASGMKLALAPTANGIRDASNNLATFAATTVADGMAPLVVSLATVDTNRDGVLDQITASFSETLASPYTAAPAAGWTITKPAAPAGWATATPAVTAVALSGAIATLTIGGAGIPFDTAATGLKLALAPTAGGIRDAAGNLGTFGATAVSDGIAPILTGVTFPVPGTPGLFETGDKMTATFSEAVAPTWGASAAITVTLSRANGGGSTAFIDIPDLTNGAFDTTIKGYIASNKTATWTATITSAGSTVSVTLGTCSGSGCASLSVGTLPAGGVALPLSPTILDTSGNVVQTPSSPVSVLWF